MKKCFVDRNFKVTSGMYAAKGIVHTIGSKMEIVMLKPIAHDGTLSQAWGAVMDYGRRMYAGKSVNFPSLDGCLLANYCEKTPLIVQCYTSTTITNRGKKDSWLCIDADGRECAEQKCSQNIYIAVTLSHDEFYQINPWFDLGPFLTKLPR